MIWVWIILAFVVGGVLAASVIFGWFVSQFNKWH